MRFSSPMAGLWFACWLAAAAADAQSASPQSTAFNPDLQNRLQTLVRQVQSEHDAGKTNEADFAGELKTLDSLLANEKGAKTEEAALIAFMKAQLYLEVIQNDDKGAELVRQIKVDYPNTVYGTNADRILKAIAKRKAARSVQDRLAAGAAVPDFAVMDLAGKPLSPAALKGKVVLLDFWATWCPPCRAELPNVVSLYRKYHASGLEIIGISLDSDRNELDRFLTKQDGMTWPQFFDGQGWENQLATEFGVQAIPFTLLIGPDGKIIAKGLRADDLEAAVARAVAAK